MIIPITLSSENSHSKLPAGLARISNDEIVLVELQGALDTGNSHPVERNGKFIGKLSIDDALKKPTLLIGHHLLEGKVATIPKPLAIMHRTNSAAKSSTSTGFDEGHETMDVDGEQEERTMPQWTILGLVKKKIIFSKRPMPVIKRS